MIQLPMMKSAPGRLSGAVHATHNGRLMAATIQLASRAPFRLELANDGEEPLGFDAAE